LRKPAALPGGARDGCVRFVMLVVGVAAGSALLAASCVD
jgi:hypothetical protein